MNFLFLLIVSQCITLSIATNGSFIDHYVNPSVRSYCSEIQEKLEFKYSFRARKSKNVNSHAVYLFTEDKLFSIWQMTAALQLKESTSYVIPELFFNDVEVKDLTDFWDGRHPNNTFNTVFSDPNIFDTSFWISGSEYRRVKIDVQKIKVKGVDPPINQNQSVYGFMKNQKIVEKGLENIFGVDIADTPGYRPIRVFVRDVDDEGNAISFAFSNNSQTVEEFENGKHYNYTFDSAAFLVYATSLSANPKADQYVNYFELRTRKGMFSVFDFTYNRDFLLIGTNEELMGCPPSFCHSREFDDIIRLHDGTKLLVFHEWVWNFEKPGLRIEWEEAIISNMSSRQHISKIGNFRIPFKFGVRHIVDGSFTDQSILYIFRNGSFISSNNDSIIHNRTAFPDYTPISQVFTGVPSQTYDSILYHKQSRNVFFFKEDMFWMFSMANKSLTSQDFPKLTPSLGLPYNFSVKSIFVEEEDNSGKQIEFYLFTENHYIVFKENEFDGNQFVSGDPTYYCTSVNFFGCTDGQFECPQLETSPPSVTTSIESQFESSPIVTSPTTTTVTSTTARSPEPIEKGSNVWIYVIIVVIIIVVLIIGIAVFVFYVIRPKKSSEPENNAKEDTPNEAEANKSKSKSKGKGDLQLDSIETDATRSTY